MAAQELLPGDMDFAYLGGEAGVDDQGQAYYVTFEGWREIGEQSRASGCAFRITVAPDGIPSSPAGEILHVLDGPNNEIDGVEIYAANMTLSTSTAISGKIGDSYTTTDYCLGFLLEGDQPLGVTLQACGNTGIEFSGIVVCSVCHTYLLFVDFPQSASLTAPGLCATCA